ncbi:MAG: succinylglutamate desuccinylase/aspartoacylase family protein [Desulforhopalus sp.]|jgi:predicted deacylase|nr:succinylglutamate desuccinylase/aspartoacylase family protein [Desulforhopalus sp.]
MKTTEIHQLSAASPGTARSLTVLRYGTPGARPKAYLQAGLHADEAPSFIVLHHLRDRLDQAAAAGLICGEIVVVPAANPIGLAQWRDDALQGRFDFVNSVNFNRSHHDLVERVAAAVAGKLAADPEQNVALIRAAIANILGEIVPEDEAGQLKHLLYQLSSDADIVLDLHCDHQALAHLYLGTPLWPAAADLSAQLGMTVTLLASDSGGTPFDEANSRPWWNLAERFPQFPIPPACLAATVELRGICDTDHHLTAGDAENLFIFLQRRGCISGAAPPLPEMVGTATPLTGVDYIKATLPGVVVFVKKPGDWVNQGDVVAEIINPLAEGARSQVVRTETTGRLFARIADRYARPGRIIAKVAGAKELRPAEGNLLTL